MNYSEGKESHSADLDGDLGPKLDEELGLDLRVLEDLAFLFEVLEELDLLG